MSQIQVLLCQVCGDKSSGKHYGVPSCDGCRGFFKRSIRKKIKYVCKVGGKCIIDVARRNQCQACRFRKCIQVNMRKESVQHERAPKITTTTTDNELIINESRSRYTRQLSNMHYTAAAAAAAVIQQHNSSTDFIPAAAAAALLLSNPLPCYIPPPPIPPLINWSSSNFLFRQPQCEEVTSSDVLESNGNPSPRSFSMQIIDNTSEAAARLLFIAVKWAFSMPSFLQFSTEDQKMLIRSAWGELFVLTSAQWSFPNDCNFDGINNNLLEEIQAMKLFVRKCAILNVDPTEFECLKALALFKPESRGIRDIRYAEILQEQTHILLGDHCVNGGRNEASARRRLARLLLLLTASKRPTTNYLHELFFRNTVGEIPIEHLLSEMQRSHI